ncbi:hypothetical protein AVEN_273042-1 [Araneus ventricosus]|uniref:Uncharacterized protein n=1 Tax=Araneus ventricosus TaxID=182803 RepID=A0A4Y2RXU7_ARAVE|nr:hypothetical protein AVEN_273042-1 [Araneus ventricosus]
MRVPDDSSGSISSWQFVPGFRSNLYCQDSSFLPSDDYRLLECALSCLRLICSAAGAFKSSLNYESAITLKFELIKGINQSLQIRQKTGRYGYLNNHNDWRDHKTDNVQDSSNGVTSSLDSNDSLKYAILSELDDFVPDRTVNDKYSYSHGGFYIPHEREGKLNYHLEEVTGNVNGENNKLIPDEKSSHDSNSKVLTGSSQTGTGVIESPSILSVLKKAFLNPLFIISAAAVPLALIIEMAFPYLMNIFSGNMLPTVASTIVTGFARSMDGDMTLQAEKVLDVINEFGVKALEDTKCLQGFLCRFAKSQSDSHLDGSWSIKKVMKKFENSVHNEILDKFGLKPLFNSVEKGSCESLLCKGSPAYTQDVPLLEKLYFLGRKVFNLTEVMH